MHLFEPTTNQAKKKLTQSEKLEIVKILVDPSQV